MFKIEIISEGVGEIVLVISLIIAPLIIGFIVAYIVDKNWQRKVNDFFLKIWLGFKDCFLFKVKQKETSQIKKSQIVSCKLGDQISEGGKDGIILIDFKGDGKTVKEIVEKEFIRRTNNKNNDLYFYFAFREDVVNLFRKRPIIILIEYLDRDQGDAGSAKDDGKRGLRLNYDGVGDDFDSIWKEAGHITFTDIAGGWKWAGFNIKDGNFQRRQNNVGDFRIACHHANPKRDYDLYLRRVMVVR